MASAGNAMGLPETKRDRKDRERWTRLVQKHHREGLTYRQATTPRDRAFARRMIARLDARLRKAGIE